MVDISLKVGVAVRDITPAVGGHLYGYRPDVFSKSVNDALTATAVALCSPDIQTIIISAAVCLIQTGLANRIRQLVGEKTGVKASHVLLSAFHTHSGPSTAGMVGWGDLDEEYCECIFIPRIVEAAVAAVEAARPALTGVASAWSHAGINRRQQDLDGVVRLGQNPWGPYDGNLTVVAFREPDGQPIVNLVHYGAHCTAAGVNTEITRDWAGVMVDRLAAESGAPTAFLQGAEGDVGPRLSNGLTTADLSYIYETGGIAAVDAIHTWRSIKRYENLPLRAVQGTLSLPRREAIPLEEARRGLAAAGDASVNLEGQVADYYRRVVAAYENGDSPEPAMKLAQTLVSLGGIVFVPMPFEPFSEISLRMRAYSPFPYTLCLGCTNGNEGYLPTQTQLCLGGYEVSCFETSSVWSLAPDTDSHIISENIRLMEELTCTE